MTKWENFSKLEVNNVVFSWCCSLGNNDYEKNLRALYKFCIKKAFETTSKIPITLKGSRAIDLQKLRFGSLIKVLKW